MPYKHTQYSLIFISIFCLLVGLARYMWTATGNDFFTGLILLLPLFLLSSFLWMTVTVTEEIVRVKFGWGLFRKTFQRENIASIKVVHNRWFHGWGIHYWMWPKMWVMNIDGFNALELTMKNGRIYRIGTDEPKKLETTLIKK